MVIKIKLGPDSGDKPKLNIAGKINNPARTAIEVSINTIQPVLVIRFSLLLVYPPKVNAIAIPIPMEKNN